MLKKILKFVKWYFLFWIYLFAAALITAVVAGLLAGLFGIEANIGLMLLGFTAILIAEHVLRGKRKNAAVQAELKAKEAAEEAKREAARLKNEYAAAIDRCREQLEANAQKIKDRTTASKVADIAVLMRKIALEVEADERDRKKIRGLSDHSGQMIVDLTEKYIKLERQNQVSGNITSAMEDIRNALDVAETSLKTLLDDLFSNDGAEVAVNAAVLESILTGVNPEYRMDLGMETEQKQAQVMTPCEEVASNEA